jgi:trimethylamine--corrinoid protein Co-methyltransferase
MTPDAQAALEKMLGFHTHMESGVTCVWGVGQLESEMTFSPAQAVMDSEMISFVRRYARGYDASDASLAVDVTREVGIGGSFLDHPHTFERFRQELFMPRLLCRERRPAWVAAGGRRLDQVAEDAADELMRQPVACGLTEGQLRDLDALADGFLARFGASPSR